MPARRRADPLEDLVRAIDRLARRRPYVTLADLERQGAAPRSRLHGADVAALVAACVEASLIFADRRTFFDRAQQSYRDAWVYRVNPRHPTVGMLVSREDG